MTKGIDDEDLIKDEDDFRRVEQEQDIKDERERAELERRIQPIPGLTVNGKPVLRDFETGEIVDEFGNPVDDDKPFSKGDVVVFAGDRYEVLVNYGSTGTVKALDDGGIVVKGFRWEFEGEKCRRVNSCEALQIIDGVVPDDKETR